MGTAVVPPGLFPAFPPRCPTTRVSAASLFALQALHGQLRQSPVHRGPSGGPILESE